MKYVINNNVIDRKELKQINIGQEGTIFIYNEMIVKIFHPEFLKTDKKRLLELSKRLITLDKEKKFEIIVPPKSLVTSVNGSFRGVTMEHITVSNMPEKLPENYDEHAIAIQNIRKMTSKDFFNMLKRAYIEIERLTKAGILMCDEFSHDQILFDTMIRFLDFGSYCLDEEISDFDNISSLNGTIVNILFDRLGYKDPKDDTKLTYEELQAATGFRDSYFERFHNSDYETMLGFIIEDFGKAKTVEEYILRFS